MSKKKTAKDGGAAVAEADVEVRSVDPEVVDAFRRVLEIGPDDSVPSGLLRLYARWKRRVDFCSAGAVVGKDLIMLVTLYEQARGDEGEALLPPIDE